MAAPQPGRLWGVVLANAKPAASLASSAAGSKAGSNLPRALERARLAIPPESTVVVGTRRDQPRLSLETATFPGNVLIQPESRGSAPLLLWPLYWIHRFDPEAIVVSIPADQSVREESLLMDHVSRVAARIPSHPRWIVMVGAPPPDPDPEHEWIVRAESLDDGDERVWRVRELQEARSTAPSRTSLSQHSLWNTQVLVGRVQAFVDAARACLPALHAAFSEASRSAGSWEEPDALERAYERIEECQFFHALMAAAFPRLAASCLPSLHWGERDEPARRRRPATANGLRESA
jgi:mannose-1-phosphate guanylyltransferase